MLLFCAAGAAAGVDSCGAVVIVIINKNLWTISVDPLITLKKKLKVHQNDLLGFIKKYHGNLFCAKTSTSTDELNKL